MKTELNEQVLKWFATGNVGMSSKAMACAAIGFKTQDAFFTPSDVDDLSRCIHLVHMAPLVRGEFHKIAAISPTWKRIIDNWDALESKFMEEVGIPRHPGQRMALKTRAFLDKVLRGQV